MLHVKLRIYLQNVKNNVRFEASAYFVSGDSAIKESEEVIIIKTNIVRRFLPEMTCCL